MKSNVPTSDSGAVAIDLQGDDNVVADNRISGSDACSRFFSGRDGSAISVYGGRHNVIHHNVSSQNHDFIELGDPRTRDTLIAYNADHSTLPRANFAVVHGLGLAATGRSATPGSSTTRACSRARARSPSSARMCSRVTTSRSRATSCGARTTPSTCNDGFVESDNIYWASDGRPSVTFEIAPTSRKVDPRLVDPRDGDLHLLPDSPAIDAIRPMDLGDIGAHGRRRRPGAAGLRARTSAPTSTRPTDAALADSPS